MMKSFKSINPANGKEIASYSGMDKAEVEQIIEKAGKAQVEWARLEVNERARIIGAIADELRRRKDKDSRLMALEMGKPLAQGVSEIEKCAWLVDYYSEHAAAHLKSQAVQTEATDSYVAFEALGTILAIMPWNFPFWQVCRFSIPALLAGNAVILKHAENTFGCAEAIEEIMHHSGLPADLFRSVRVDVEQTADIIRHPGVAAVSLTGSTRAGKAVAQIAGSVLKPCVLELGGNDPYLIFDDADIEHAVEACVNSRLINSGQSCIAAKRLIVHASHYDEFCERMEAELRKKKVDDPLQEATDVGPLARMDLRDELHRQVSESVNKGAVCVMGGDIPDGEGAFYPITLLKDVETGMPAFEEELFGPVAVIIKAASNEHAIKLANDSRYGLGAAVFSADEEKARLIAEKQLQAGCCFVNDFVRSDPRLPFGGIKESGYGRELSVFGIREFVNIKTVYVA
jgi:succinate-semialdehyde dehydrogenase/glutarate-semialdehyde dehydrogenase